MKKLLLLILGIVSILALAGCGSKDPSELGSVQGYVYYEQVLNSDSTGFKSIGASSKIIVVEDPELISATTKPLSGAAVTVDGGLVAATNSSGYFKLTGINPGTRTVTVSHPQFRDSLTQKVTVKAGQTITLSSAHMGQAYNVIVGIGDYSDGGQQSLTGPPNDARAMAGALTNAFKSTTKVILNTEATKSNILSSLETAVATINRNYSNYGAYDYLFFTFSGHGYIDSIVTADGQLITDSELADIFDNLPLALRSNVVVILDTCYSGSLVDGRSLKQVEAAPRQLLGLGCTVLAASRANELSLDADGMGEFTRYLVAGLGANKKDADENEDRQVTAKELFNYAEEQVHNETIKWHEIDSSIEVQNPDGYFPYGIPSPVLARY